jgi:FtsZ-interacting cell division protein ZipA
MLYAADKITKQLQGRLCDDKRHTLTQEKLESMRSQILNFNLMKEGDNH